MAFVVCMVTPKRLYLIAPCGDKDKWAMDALKNSLICQALLFLFIFDLYPK